MITFLLVAAAAIAAGIGVIAARNAVHSVLWLVVHLCSLAVLYMTLQAQFLGLVQILLYAGAVMVLFLFVLSLLSARSAAAGPGGGRLPLQVGFAVGAAVVVALLVMIGAAVGTIAPAAAATTGGAAGAATTGGAAGAFGSAAAFGQALFGPYLLPFEATALALLTAIVGVVALSAGHDEAMRHGLPVEEQQHPEGAPIEVSHAAAAEPVLTGGER